MVLLSVLVLYLLSFLRFLDISPKFTQKNKEKHKYDCSIFQEFQPLSFSYYFPFILVKFCLVDYISFLNPKGAIFTPFNTLPFVAIPWNWLLLWYCHPNLQNLPNKCYLCLVWDACFGIEIWYRIRAPTMCKLARSRTILVYSNRFIGSLLWQFQCICFI